MMLTMPQFCTRHPGNVPPVINPELFRVCVNGTPVHLDALLGCLTLRTELSQPSDHWIWKIIAKGRAGRMRVSIGLYLDHDLQPGRHTLVDNPKIQVVYNDTPNARNRIYHSQHLQSGTLNLMHVDREHRHLQGEFEFGISALGFRVSGGRFNLPCPWQPEPQR